MIALLLDAPTIGPRRALDLLRVHGSAEEVIESLRAGSGTSARVLDYLAEQRLDPYIELMERTGALGGEFKLWSDDDYPANLARWDGRPPVLYYKGDLMGIGEKALALVGRVDPSEVGVEAAGRFARKCVENGISVISGLAKGIDAASHRSALLPPPGQTYAVVGHGLDFAYPRENHELYKAIPERGAVITQFRVGVGPQKWTFPARNEVMCTLALGTVIVEGKTGCGSIIQADFSFKHGRPVFLLKRNLAQSDNQWALDLVRRGAHVIEHFDQVLDVVEVTGQVWRREDSTVADALFPVELVGQGAVGAIAPSKAALFDLDGVVVDSREATRRALASIASRHTRRDVAPDEVSPLASPYKELERLGVRDAYKVYRSEYDSEFLSAANSISTFAQVVETLHALRNAGVHLGAITAQPRRRAEAMLPAPVMALFEVFLCYNETRGDKSTGIAKALKVFDVARDQALYVGDQPKDMEAARKAGVAGVAVLWGFSDEQSLVRWLPDVTVSEQSELTDVLLAVLDRQVSRASATPAPAAFRK